MAITTINTYLMIEKNGTYEKLIDITEFPDLGSSPDAIDVTTLSDKVQRNLLGLQKLDNLEFGANFDKTDYAKIQALASATDPDNNFAILFGANSNGEPDGHNGIVTFAGSIACNIKGGKVNEAVGMTITIACSEAPELVTSLPNA